MSIQSIMMNAMQNAISQNQQNFPAFNPQKMKSLMPGISNQQMEQFKQQARMMGISEQQIEEGIALLNKLK